MKTPRQVVSTAITSWVEVAEKQGVQPATQVKLCHIAEGRPPLKVQSWIVTRPGTNLTELVQNICDVANEHAHSGKAVGAEEYHLIPYFGAGEEVDEGGFRRFVVHVARSGGEDDGIGYTEGPNKAGMIHMDMRHLEKRHEQLDRRDELLWNTTSEEMKRLREENKQLRAELKAANDGLEEAKDQSLERKLKIFRANQEEQRKDKLIDAVIPVAMQLGNAAIGAPVFNVNTDDQSQQAIISFLSGLKTKQIEHIYQGLEPHQRMFMDHVLEEIKKMKLAEFAQKQKEAGAKVNGVETDPRTMETLAKRSEKQPEAET